MTTHQIVIVNQAMRLQPIRNLMTRKASLTEMMSQLKMLKMEHLDGVQDYQINMDDQEEPLDDKKRITAEASYI